MRPYLAAAVLVAALAPVTPSSAEDVCLVRVEPLFTRFDHVEATATLTCTASFPGMAVTTCVESLKPSSPSAGFAAEDCFTDYARPGETSVIGFAWSCIAGGPSVVRGAAYAVDAAGRPVSGFGQPTVVAGVENCGF